MTSKFSRAAMIAGLAIGGGGLVVPSEAAAANKVATVNYYVNNPVVTGVGAITPESAVVYGAVDTGGNPESLLPVASTGLVWNPISGVTVSAEKWNDGTSPANTTSGSYAPLDGLPVSGSNTNVSVTVTDSGAPSISGVPLPVANGGADNYSDVTFEYDPVSDYVANGDQPGPNVQFAQDLQVPTAAGTSSVSTQLGAFGVAAQNNTGNAPLQPGTQYYYWIVQQAGATDQAVNVNVAAWANTQTASPPAYNPSYKCLPIAAVQQDPTLNGYYQAYVAGQNPTVTYPDNAADAAATPPVTTSQPAIQGPCIYYYGNTGGSTYYQSPNGEFATPKLGKVKIGAQATVTASHVFLSLSNRSAYKASGVIALTVGGKLAGTAKFHLAPNGTGSAKVVLTARGKAAVRANRKVRVAPISATATVASVSNWDQPFVGRSVKL